jgi:hypothetical protein
MFRHNRDYLVGESCTIFNQTSYSYFQSSSPCFTILLIIKMDSNRIKVNALLDSKASAAFIDKDFANHHKLPLVLKKHPIPIKLIDDTPLVSRDVIHETTSLDIILEGHHSIIAFNVIKSPSNSFLLGLFWLD